jgi:chromate transporter
MWNSKIIEILKLFFHLGLVAFGGPAAHIAMIHKEVVEKRKWIDEKHFLDLIGATALIPGPNSTEMVIHCGLHRGGLIGMLVAGLSFILPACLITGVLAYAYVEFSSVPNFDQYMLGLRPVVMILIFEATKKLWKKAIKENFYIFIALIVFILGLLSIGEVWALLCGGIIGFFILKYQQKTTLKMIEPLGLFLVFAKIGSVLFGSGYVLVAYLQDELITKRGWLTVAQLTDAIGIGQFTPGPVLSTSTFIGYITGGSWGAVAATIGIFAPSFVFVYLLRSLIPKMRSSKNFSLFLDAINAGVIGMMGYALVFLGKYTLNNPASLITLAIMSLLYFKFSSKFNAITLVLIGGVLGPLVNLLI